MDESENARAAVSSLTWAELHVLKSLVAGESVRTMAGQLELSISEVGAIKDSMMRKLAALRDADAVRMGLLAGLEERAGLGRREEA